MLSILLFPHLPLRSATAVGDWKLAPIGELDQHPVRDDRREVVMGLLRLYGLPESDGRFGAVAYHNDRRIGDEFEPTLIPPLRRAVTTALLALNPEPAPPDPQRPIGRRNISTTDNGVAWGHNIQDDGWVAADTGFITRILHGGYNVLDPESLRIPRSPDLHLPFVSDFDGEYATAILELITREIEAGRRLATTIDWLLVAWQNTSVMDGPLRVMALKTGFEVLLEASDVWTLRDRLSDLLDADDEPRSPRTWPGRNGGQQTADLTDLQWAFQTFTFLRNDIAHGHPITAARFTHDTGQPLLFLGEWWLRRAIFETVARAGHEDLRMTRTVRQMVRRLRELDDTSQGDGEP